MLENFYNKVRNYLVKSANKKFLFSFRCYNCDVKWAEWMKSSITHTSVLSYQVYSVCPNRACQSTNASLKYKM